MCTLQTCLILYTGKHFSKIQLESVQGHMMKIGGWLVKIHVIQTHLYLSRNILHTGLGLSELDYCAVVYSIIFCNGISAVWKVNWRCLSRLCLCTQAAGSAKNNVAIWSKCVCVCMSVSVHVRHFIATLVRTKCTRRDGKMRKILLYGIVFPVLHIFKGQGQDLDLRVKFK